MSVSSEASDRNLSPRGFIYRTSIGHCPNWTHLIRTLFVSSEPAFILIPQSSTYCPRTDEGRGITEWTILISGGSKWQFSVGPKEVLSSSSSCEKYSSQLPWAPYKILIIFLGYKIKPSLEFYLDRRMGSLSGKLLLFLHHQLHYPKEDYHRPFDDYRRQQKACATWNLANVARNKRRVYIKWTRNSKDENPLPKLLPLLVEMKDIEMMIMTASSGYSHSGLFIVKKEIMMMAVLPKIINIAKSAEDIIYRNGQWGRLSIISKDV